MEQVRLNIIFLHLDDRPYVDCCTVTPMTGNGLVKFDRFNAMNKLPWDDVGDQFVIQVSKHLHRTFPNKARGVTRATQNFIYFFS